MARLLMALLGVSIVLAAACVAVGGRFILHRSPECLLPGAVLGAGGVVALSAWAVALALWVRLGGKA